MWINRFEPAVVDLPCFQDVRGVLTVAEFQSVVPFQISRVFFISNVPEHEVRAGHAHRATEEFLIAVSGEFQIEYTSRDGKVKNIVLDSPQRGFYVPALTWMELSKFSKSAICLVLASTQFDSQDYIGKFEEFLKLG